MLPSQKVLLFLRHVLNKQKAVFFSFPLRRLVLRTDEFVQKLGSKEKNFLRFVVATENVGKIDGRKCKMMPLTVSSEQLSR